MVTLGFKPFTRLCKPACSIMQWKCESFQCIAGEMPCLKKSIDVKYLVSDVKHNRGMYTFPTNYENEYLKFFIIPYNFDSTCNYFLRYSDK